MSYVLAIDLGTSGCRSAIYNEKLEMLCVAAEEYPLIVHSETEIEQDANIWWEKAKSTIKTVVADSRVDAKEIHALSISSQGIAFVPIDSQGNTLSNAISWLDMRAQAETEEIEERYGMQQIYQRTGKRISGAYSLPKLIWFKNNRPDVYEAADKILLPLDFIQYRLTGRSVTDHTMAGGTMLYNVQTQTWDKDILDTYGLDIKKLPEISWSGTVIGKIDPAVALELGLCEDLPVVNGAQDQKCAALGAGASEDVVAISLGTGSCLAQITSSPRPDAEMRIPFFSYVRQGQWDLEGVINTAGSAYSWFQREIGGEQSFAALDEAAEGVRLPNSVMFYPYMSGVSSPNWGGGTGTFTGLSLLSTTAHMTRAVMEGIAYNIRENLEAMEGVCSKAKEIRLYGGGSKSMLWCQIIANVTSIPVTRLCSSETALAGAAILAYTPLGVSVPYCLNCADTVYPEPDIVDIYNESYKIYEKTRKKYFS